jgi:hypothetical protein
VTIIRTALSEKMHALADTGHVKSAQLRDLAGKFDIAANGFYADPQTVKAGSMLGAWARASRLWCEVSGDPLI